MNTFVELLRHQFVNNPDKPAIINRIDTVTFAELYDNAKTVAARLQQSGLKSGDRVILYTADKLSFLIIHLGIILSGGVSLPLNFDFTKEEMLFFLNDSAAQFVFASGKQALVINEIKSQCTNLRAVINPAKAIAENHRRQPKEINVQADDPCFILYSSGTTGKPKGIVHTQANVASSLLSLQKAWRFVPDDILLNVLPLFHIHGLSFAAHLSFISGSTMILEDKFHPLKTMEQIANVTVFMAVPTMYYAFLRKPEFKTNANKWTKTRLFTCGSAPIQARVLTELEAILKSPLINRYGMSESHVLTSLPLDGPFPHGSVGLPLDGVEIKLLTDDDRTLMTSTTQEHDDKIVGEVKVKSKHLFSYYWNDPAALAKTFDKDGYFSTGDLGYFDELGFLTLVGRKSDLIIISGFNVYPAIIERVINSYSQVKESAVFGIDHQNKGEKVAAAVVANGNLDIDELKKYCARRLVNYQVPTHFEIIDELPRNTMGKVLKRSLKLSIA
ncbi:MAG: acyl--CoA ligase [Psychromonas sp.]|nr:acyl--CoA ligase [Psychromonas sp.]